MIDAIRFQMIQQEVIEEITKTFPYCDGKWSNFL